MENEGLPDLAEILAVWVLLFLAKVCYEVNCRTKLFSNIILIIGLYDALEISGL